MFAQCTWKCASSVLLLALLSCVLSPPAHASKVSEQLLTQALSVVQQAQKWKRNNCFFMKICKGKKCCKRSVLCMDLSCPFTALDITVASALPYVMFWSLHFKI